MRKTDLFLKIIFFFVAYLTFHPLGHLSAKEKNVYQDVERGFSLEVPSGWEVYPQKKGELAVALVKRTPLKPFNPSIIVSVLASKLPMPTTKEELDMIVGQISGPSATIPNIENFKVTKSALDKRKGILSFFYQTTYELKRASKKKDKKVRTLNYIFTDRGKYLAVTLVVPANEYRKYEKICYRVIESLTLTDVKINKAKKRKG